MYGMSDNKILMLRPDDILPSKFTQRTVVDTGELDRLCESISSSGVIEPLCVRKAADGKYELISGTRRLLAAKAIKLRRVPCIVRKGDDISCSIFALSENLHRCRLDFFDEAKAIENILVKSGFTQSELAIRLGISNSTLCNKLKLLKLSISIRQRISAASLSEQHARALLQIPEEEREMLLDKIIAEGLNVKQTQVEVEKMLSPKCEESKKPSETPIRKAAIGDIRLFANSLSKLLLTLNGAGISANSKKTETENYIEYKVHIKKNTKPQEEKYEQLRIC